jgi:hypothetical protein
MHEYIPVGFIVYVGECIKWERCILLAPCSDVYDGAYLTST